MRCRGREWFFYFSAISNTIPSSGISTLSPAYIFFPLAVQISPFTLILPSAITSFASPPVSDKPVNFKSESNLMNGGFISTLCVFINVYPFSVLSAIVAADTREMYTFSERSFLSKVTTKLRGRSCVQLTSERRSAAMFRYSRVYDDTVVRSMLNIPMMSFALTMWSAPM